MGTHRGYTGQPLRDAARVATGHALAAWDYLLSDLPRGSQCRRDIAWVVSFVIAMLVLLVASVLLFGDWTSTPATSSAPAPWHTVRVTIPASAVLGWCTELGCWPPGVAVLPQVRVLIGR